MISKRLAFFLVVLTAGGIYGSLQLPRDRDLPRFPPEVAMFLGEGGTALPAKPPAPKPDRGEPETNGGAAGEPDDPRPTPVPAGDGVRVSTVNLQGIEVGATTPVSDPGDSSFVVVTIDEQGNTSWGGFDTGSFEMLGTMMENNAGIGGFHMVVAPDRNVPWKYVHWVLAMAREQEIPKVSLAGYPDSDAAGTLLAALRADVLAGGYEGEAPEGMDTIRVKVFTDEDGEVKYELAGEVAAGAPELNRAVSPWNSEYATFFGADYSRKAGRSPWVLLPEADVPAGKVLRAMAAMRLAAIYAFRVDGDYGPPPGK